MQLNSIFRNNIHDIYQAEGDLWLQKLPEVIKLLSHQWNFRFLHSVSDLSYNFVGHVELNDTRNTAILKIAPKKGDLSSEVKWLNCFDKGVPKIYKHDQKYNAFLMEHLFPGNPLKTLVRQGKDDEATQIICETIRNLQFQHRGEIEFTHLSELPHVLELLKDHVDNKLLSAAQAWFHEFTLDRSQDVLLHGDLHHDNIILSEAGWRTIDPHGYIGDPVAEVGAMFKNPLDCFPRDRSLAKVIETRLHIMKDQLPFDPKKIKAWAFCITMLSAAWTLEGHAKLAEFELAVAQTIYQTKI